MSKGFTVDELKAMAAADAEIEANFRLTQDDLDRSRALDRTAYFDALPPEKRKVAAYRKAYREANRERIAAYRKVYREANRERVASQQKAYYEANRERIAAYQKAYREANRERVAAYQKAYRERKRREKS